MQEVPPPWGGAGHLLRSPLTLVPMGVCKRCSRKDELLEVLRALTMLPVLIKVAYHANHIDCGKHQTGP